MFWSLLLGLALMVIGYILMPKPKTAKPDSVTELEAPTAEAGRPIAVPFGEILFKSPNFLWWGDKYYSKRSKKAKKK